MAQRTLQKPREGAEFLLVWAAWGIVIAVLLWLVLRFVPLRWPWWSKPYLLAIQTGLIGLFAPVYLYVWRSRWEELDWDGNFLNKRWLLALYWMAVLTFLILPHAWQRLMRVAQPDTQAAVQSRP